jgi:hypothetical protein
MGEAYLPKCQIRLHNTLHNEHLGLAQKQIHRFGEIV